MIHKQLICFFVLLVNTFCLAAGNLITFAPPVSKQNDTDQAGGKCFLTAECENCSQTAVKCYANEELQTLVDSQFREDFCGPHGVVLVKRRVADSNVLSPLKCRNGICPDGSECVNNPDDGLSYCCSVGSKDLASSSLSESANISGPHANNHNVSSAYRWRNSTEDSEDTTTSVTSTSPSNIVVDTFPTEVIFLRDIDYFNP